MHLQVHKYQAIRYKTKTKQNPDQMEVIPVRKADALERLYPILWNGMEFPSAEQMKSLGAVMDPVLLFEKQVGGMTMSTFCQLYSAHQSFFLLCQHGCAIHAFVT